MRCTNFFFQTEVVKNQNLQLLCYVIFSDILHHYGVIAASQICSVEKVLCRLMEQTFVILNLIFYFLYFLWGGGAIALYYDHFVSLFVIFLKACFFFFFFFYIWPPPGGICFCRCLSVCLSVQHNSKSYGSILMKFSGINCYIKIWNGSFLKGLGQRSRSNSIKRSNSLKWL